MGAGRNCPTRQERSCIERLAPGDLQAFDLDRAVATRDN
jgi:hypothetical protein